VKKFIVFTILIITVLAFSFLITEQIAAAKPVTKIHFTKTFTSYTDPGSKNGQLTLVLPPNKDSIYTGSLSFVSNSPVKMMILHQITKQESKGQPTWTVDGNNIYAVTESDATSSATLAYTGTAIAFKSNNPFVVTASIDAWVRGQPIDFVSQTTHVTNPEIRLVDQNIPISIPSKEKNRPTAPREKAAGYPSSKNTIKPPNIMGAIKS